MDQELALCQIALKERQADAWERVDRAKLKIMSELSRLKELEAISNHPKYRPSPQQHSLLIDQLRQRAEPHLARLAQLEAIIAEFGGRTMDRLGGATAEQILLEQIGKHTRSDPLIRLLAAKHLTIEQVVYGREIARIIDHIAHRSYPTVSKLPTADQTPDAGSVQRRADMADYAEHMAILHAKVYMPWADRQRVDAKLQLTLGICVEGRSVEELRRTYRLNWDTVMKRVQEALDAYAIFRDRWERGVPEPRQRATSKGSARVRASGRT